MVNGRVSSPTFLSPLGFPGSNGRMPPANQTRLAGAAATAQPAAEKLTWPLLLDAGASSKRAFPVIWRVQPAAVRWKICRDALEPSLTAHALSASTAATEARSMGLAPGMGSGSAVHLPSSPSLRTVLCAPTA